MGVISAIPRIRERLWRDRTEAYGYSFLLMEHHCLVLCDGRAKGYLTSVETARWFLNKFCYESQRFRATLRVRGDRLLLGYADSSELQGSVIRYQLCLLEAIDEPWLADTYDAIDRVSDALNVIKAHMWSVLPTQPFGQRPTFAPTIVPEPA